MVRKSQIDSMILFSGLVIAGCAYGLYETYRYFKPPRPIPVQSWDKYVDIQSKAKRDMSTGPFQRVAPVTPPLKGSFPLDHEGQCKVEMLKYMLCLHEANQHSTECRGFARDYLKCRMDAGLMEQDDLARLGFKEHTPE
ncbi:hypothetical protein QR680_009041 [Steinernema hermaphroditum]|uniref:CHCH domain-containing protein n=1 Tax=Steinernema hermaphroditum TaxID=289476 RepID=A0AA39M8Z0_9BILA|nr:hypothetical protein QR680_009041 [Steinernema hermaphroditum]